MVGLSEDHDDDDFDPDPDSDQGDDDKPDQIDLLDGDIQFPGQPRSRGDDFFELHRVENMFGEMLHSKMKASC